MLVTRFMFTENMNVFKFFHIGNSHLIMPCVVSLSLLPSLPLLVSLSFSLSILPLPPPPLPFLPFMHIHYSFLLHNFNRFDVGRIVSTKAFQIPWDMKSEALRKELAVIGANELITVMEDLPGALQKAVVQPSKGATKGEDVCVPQDQKSVDFHFMPGKIFSAQ